MTGSRSSSSRPGGTSSLEALNRTIEGLEARIEGLMHGLGPEKRAEERPQRERIVDRERRAETGDPLFEIRERQRALEAQRERASRREEARNRRDNAGREPPARDFSYRDALQRERDGHRDAIAAGPAGGYPRQPPARSGPIAPPPARDYRDARPQRDSENAGREITEALISLRQELKKDISEGFAREISSLRSEMRAIRAIAEKRQGDEDFRADLARLAESIRQLGDRPREGTDGLKAEFEELRSLMDGLAREDSVRDIGSRWSALADRMQPSPAGELREDIAAIGGRLETIKEQIGSLHDGRSIRLIEDKLATVAEALERIGAQFDPQERAISRHFSGLDMRLEEISRSLASGLRTQSGGIDRQVIDRLEDRLASIAQQIDTLSEQALMRDEPIGDLGHRIEALSGRIEELAQEQAASRLEERIEQLSLLVEETQRPVDYPELTGFLADISRKIDALERGDLDDRLAERLDGLARRIDTLEIPAAPAVDNRLLHALEERLADIQDRIAEPNHGSGNAALSSLEKRLDAIADRLDASASPRGGADPAVLRGLEAQIANLTAQLTANPADASENPAVAGRIAALEDYLATSDEYIIEAARQAAEAVMESYSQQGGRGQVPAGADLETLSALADNLRHLEEISRGSQERTSRTFDALQETLSQIANRLDNFERSSAVGAAAGSIPAGREQLAQMAAAKLAAQSDDEEAARDPFDDAVLADAQPLTASRSVLSTSEAAATERPGLLAGLGRRLKPASRKQEPAGSAAADRSVVDQPPSIDAADMLPPEEANELLEPGSGAPDIRRILERVRASQTAQRGRGEDSQGASGDRTDYIAAARRAAQAAAEEIERGARSGQAQAAQPAGGQSLFARYRRPILMAVGAVLLVVMALPLANTLVRGQKAPEPVVERSSGLPQLPPAKTVATLPAPAAVESAGAVTDANGPAAAPGAPVAIRNATPPPAAAAPGVPPAAPVSHGASDAGLPAVEQSPAGSLAIADGSAPMPDETGEASDLAVPAEIKPASLVTAAKRGDPQALFEIGARYTEGRGVKADLAAAAKWYERAADRGFAPGAYRLANLYEKGTGVERNLATARRYYQQAADKGNASAMHNLAVLYASGAEGKQDYTEAAKWFGRAAERGVTDSQFNLAILYARGNGVKADLETSYKWFAIAARDGDKDAEQKRDEVAKSMRPEQLERAKALAESWKAQPLDVDANSVNAPDEWSGAAIKTGSIDMKKAVQNIQAILNRNGYDAGTPDGVMGKKTVLAIKAFQAKVGQEPTGMVTDQLVKELLARNK